MISISNFSFYYNCNLILNNINYEFVNGKIYGIIGKNGAGKTTFLKAISGFFSINSGNILVNNMDVNKYDYLDLPLSYLNDQPSYFKDLTVLEHMLLICKIKKHKNLDNVYDLLSKLKLEKYSNYFPSSLSKGTLQRMSLGLELLRDETYLLMDEPFNGLDPIQVDIVENIIMEEKLKNKVVIVSSHDIDVLKDICDVFLILKNNKFLEFTPENLERNEIKLIISESYGD